VVEPSGPATAVRGLPLSLSGRPLALARLAWLGAASLLVGLSTGGLVRALGDPAVIAPRPVADLALTLGVSLRFLAVVSVAPLLLVVAICGVVFWRRSRDPMALLFTMTLLLFYLVASRVLLAFEGVPFLRHSAAVVFSLMLVGVTLLLALFPDGRFVPPATRWLPAASALVAIGFPDALSLAEPSLQGDAGLSPRAAVMTLATLTLILLGFLAQWHRYRYVSRAPERQQAKWVVGPLAALMLIVVVVVGLSATLPASQARWLGWALLVNLVAIVLVPIGVANALLRHRLYDIDRIISRSVSYGIVIVALAAVYAGVVVGLGAAVSTFTGQAGSDLVVAVSVLAVATLFRPLHRRVHATVDRRFNRTGHEARVAVEAFSQGLRDQVELGAVRRHLAATAEVALQPSKVTIWLADRDR
jgi:hypothetical protein